MFCGQVANEDLNSTHKRALRLLHNDYSSSFQELLRNSNECKNSYQKFAKVNA